MNRRARLFRVVLELGLLAAIGCADDETPKTDPSDDEGAVDAGASACREDRDCDDLRFCDGVERCVTGHCVAGVPPVCDDALSCTDDTCSEARGACAHSAKDEDGDGHGVATCEDEDGKALGDDCDDEDADRFPGNAEICDDADHDEDCDATSFGAVDADGDGFDDARCCNADDGGKTHCGNDCDDLRIQVNAKSTEACDGFDNDCDGKVDEKVGVPLYVDADHDGHGRKHKKSDAPVMGCAGKAGYAVLDDDCDDADPTRYPGLFELCDKGKDNDCDATTDDSDAQPTAWYRDADKDGFGNVNDYVVSCAPQAGRVLQATDCNDASRAISPVAAEKCDGIDNDCDGETNFVVGPNDTEDDDGDHVIDSACGGNDCDDRDVLTGGVGVVEVCDGRDNDCDSRVDENVSEQVWFRDADGDGYGSFERGAISTCMLPSGYSPRGDDCDDGNPQRNPGRKEQCNSIDDDCDKAIDEAPAVDVDRDGVCDARDLCTGNDLFGDSDNDGICDDRDRCVGEDKLGDDDRDGVCNGDSDGDMIDDDLCDGDDASGDDDGDAICNDRDLCYGENTSGDTDEDGTCDNRDVCNGARDRGDGTCEIDIAADAALSTTFAVSTNAGVCSLGGLTTQAPDAGTEATYVVRARQDPPGGIALYTVSRVALTFDLSSIPNVLQSYLRVYRTSQQSTAEKLYVLGGTQPVFGATLNSADFSAADTLVAFNGKGEGYAVDVFTIAASHVHANGLTQFMLTTEDVGPEAFCHQLNPETYDASWYIYSPRALQPGLRPSLRVIYTAPAM